MATNEQRLIDLETKFSFQESLVEELQQIVHEQYRQIEKLEKKLALLSDRVKGTDSGGAEIANEKPPHY